MFTIHLVTTYLIGDQLRAGLERALPDLTDGEWELLVDDGHVGEVESGAAEVGYLVERVKRLRHATSEQPSDERESAQTADPRALADRAASRSEALSALLAADAAQLDYVVSLRRDVLGEQLVEPAKVGEWIAQRSSHGEPIKRKVLGAPSEAKEGLETIAGLPVVHYETPVVEYAVPGAGWVQVAASSSKLERIRQTSELLAKRYGWQPAQATVFVLTGRVPILDAIRVRRKLRAPVTSASRIILEVDPTVTPKELAAHYSRARAAVMPTRSRRMSEKHLRLAIFTHGRTDGSWEDRMRAWGEQHPSWAYKHATNFQRDATAAIRRLIDPPFRF